MKTYSRPTFECEVFHVTVVAHHHHVNRVALHRRRLESYLNQPALIRTQLQYGRTHVERRDWHIAIPNHRLKLSRWKIV